MYHDNSPSSKIACVLPHQTTPRDHLFDFLDDVDKSGDDDDFDEDEDDDDDYLTRMMLMMIMMMMMMMMMIMMMMMLMMMMIVKSSAVRIVAKLDLLCGRRRAWSGFPHF